MVSHPSGINVASAIVGVSALAVMFLLSRTRIALFATLIAVVVPTVVVALMGLDSVQTVADVGAIPSGLPPLVPEDVVVAISSRLGNAASAVLHHIVRGPWAVNAFEYRQSVAYPGGPVCFTLPHRSIGT